MTKVLLALMENNTIWRSGLQARFLGKLFIGFLILITAVLGIFFDMALFLGSLFFSSLIFVFSALKYYYLSKKNEAVSAPENGLSLTQTLTELIVGAAFIFMGSFLFNVPELVAAASFFILMITVFFVFYPQFIQQALKRSKNLLNAQKAVHKILFNSEEKLDFYAFFIFALAIMSQILGGALLYFIALKINVNLSFLSALFLYSVATTVQNFLIIIPKGIGATEGAVIGFLIVWNLPLLPSILLVLTFRIWTIALPEVFKFFYAQKNTGFRPYFNIFIPLPRQ